MYPMPANGAGVARDDNVEAGGAGGRTVHAAMNSVAAITPREIKLRLVRGCVIVLWLRSTTIKDQQR